MANKTTGKGVVNSNPTTYKTRAQLLKARVDIKVDDVVATYWSDDAVDPHIFSFAKGDEVDVEYWQQGNFWNARILNAYGSVSEDEVKDIAAASHGKITNPGANTDFDSITDELAAMFAGCRSTLINNVEMQQALADLSEQQREEVIRQGTASLFIELQRRGYNYDEAFG
jgi:hypothetical protein